jgi:hypothetical protein
VWIRLQQCISRCQRFGASNIVHAEQRLAMQIALFNAIVVDDDQMTNTSAAQILQHCAAEPTRAHN